jgi:hypothetical protein
VPDVLGDYPGEMHMLTYELDTEQVALSYRRMPQHTGGKGSYGHFHREQEEIYFVVSGKLQFKLGGRRVRGGERNRGPHRARGCALGVERRARGRGARDRVEADRRSGERRREGADFWPE